MPLRVDHGLLQGLEVEKKRARETEECFDLGSQGMVCWSLDLGSQGRVCNIWNVAFSCCKGYRPILLFGLEEWFD